MGDSASAERSHDALFSSLLAWTMKRAGYSIFLSGLACMKYVDCSTLEIVKRGSSLPRFFRCAMGSTYFFALPSVVASTLRISGLLRLPEEGRACRTLRVRKSWVFGLAAEARWRCLVERSWAPRAGVPYTALPLGLPSEIASYTDPCSPWCPEIFGVLICFEKDGMMAIRAIQ